MKQFKYILLLLLLNSCGLKTIKLQNGYQKVAVNPNVYANKSKFNSSLLDNIDTLCIYEEYLDNKFDNVTGPARLDHDNCNSVYGAYRFYNNGCFNFFILLNKDSIFNLKTFDPDYAGWRGIYYKSKNKIKGDLITQVSGIGTIGKLIEIFEFKEDSLIVTTKTGYVRKYVKRKIHTELLQHTATW